MRKDVTLKQLAALDRTIKALRVWKGEVINLEEKIDISLLELEALYNELDNQL